MFRFLRLSFGVLVRLFRRRGSLLLENLVLRQQVSVLKRKNRRPKLTGMDRWFWVAVRRTWSGWKASLLVVKPETVVEWHRRGFRLYWQLKSKAKQIGRTPISKELQQLIFQMASENPSWGAPRIHGELKMLGFDVAERTISPALRSPWQNGVAERWVGSCRRELLNHVIPVSERHLRRLLSDYVHYYHDDRTHLGLSKQTPNGRTRTGSCGRVISFPRVGGLHHRYERAA